MIRWSGSIAPGSGAGAGTGQRAESAGVSAKGGMPVGRGGVSPGGRGSGRAVIGLGVHGGGGGGTVSPATVRPAGAAREVSPQARSGTRRTRSNGGRVVMRGI